MPHYHRFVYLTLQLMLCKLSWPLYQEWPKYSRDWLAAGMLAWQNFGMPIFGLPISLVPKVVPSHNFLSKMMASFFYFALILACQNDDMPNLRQQTNQTVARQIMWHVETTKNHTIEEKQSLIFGDMMCVKKHGAAYHKFAGNLCLSTGHFFFRGKCPPIDTVLARTQHATRWDFSTKTYTSPRRFRRHRIYLVIRYSLLL